MIVTTKEATHRTLARSQDPLRLGRWSSVLLGGQDRYRTRLVSVYNPIDTSTGPSMVHRQQTRYLREKEDFRSPRQALKEDLKSAVLIIVSKVALSTDIKPINFGYKRGTFTTLKFHLQSRCNIANKKVISFILN